MRARLAVALLAGCLASGAQAASEDATVKVLAFSDLAGWAADDHAAALSVFSQTCDLIKGREWPQLCALAQQVPDARAFFELFFRPVLIEDGAPMLFTGYFEPEIAGARQRDERFRYPVYRLPSDIVSGTPYLTRRDITEGALDGRDLEIAWVDDPVDLFFLQVQGSGRIRLADGSTIRIGYAGHNGYEYRSIGQELIRRGIYDAHQVSAKVIRNWVRRNPGDGLELLNVNQSYVFFRELPRLASDKGPIGAMHRSITTLRSIAVDPSFVPLGAPVWIEKEGKAPMRRLMIAQDTGSAIKGAQRADIFYGTGDAAGDAAGQVRDPGRMLVFLPIQLAYALVERAEG
ncbi:murein transglycosylase A [Celeribacter indicus]|uniref:peptidoglycan lytic exotransglycosylase n=1 Tax=Celeribacter indicus TaxID=1208324 RepID=A0A0B5DUK7_9RHOB|nr:MltA domain-containing protein [Celeribacter indicus]AJE44915.1 MltA/3D domain-containing protein [Celeribacter indicus]SDW97344.1 membrane-bound lytic murein transglycosylase A [Celeribacter indicus]